MSTRATGADGPISERLSVGMTVEEHRLLVAAAKRSGLSLARYLVEAGQQATRLSPSPSHFGPVEERIRGPRGYLSVAMLLLLKQAPCRLGGERPGSPDENRRRFGSGVSWAEHAAVGDVAVWALSAIVGTTPGGYADREVVGYRIGVVEVRRVRIVGWRDTREEMAEAVDAILVSHGRVG